MFTESFGITYLNTYFFSTRLCKYKHYGYYRSIKNVYIITVFFIFTYMYIYYLYMHINIRRTHIKKIFHTHAHSQHIFKVMAHILFIY